MPRERRRGCSIVGRGPMGKGRMRRRGRPMKPRNIMVAPKITRFRPYPFKLYSNLKPPILITYDELEALRLVDVERLTQEEAGEKMNVSRGTVWRLLKSGRRKLISAVLEGREILIIPHESLDEDEEPPKTMR
ncbi:MAG: DUF134 domain-containing protein [Candidatus Asgardarchaeia archaeon]